MECTRCGACCVAPDIATMGKPLGVRCPHLRLDHLCAIYEDRPEVCRRYKADDLCLAIEAPTLEERVARYLALFGLEPDAAAMIRPATPLPTPPAAAAAAGDDRPPARP